MFNEAENGRLDMEGHAFQKTLHSALMAFRERFVRAKDSLEVIEC